MGELPGEEIVVSDEVKEKLKEYGFSDGDKANSTSGTCKDLMLLSDLIRGL